MKYAKIALNLNLPHLLDYHIPTELDDAIQVGQLVYVQVRTAEEAGIIVDLHDQDPLLEDGTLRTTKPVRTILDPQPVITGAQLDMAKWISNRYLAPLGMCLWLMLPPGITGRRDVQITLLDDAVSIQDAAQQTAINLLKKRNPRLKSSLDKSLKRKNTQPVYSALVKAGVISMESVLTTPKTKPKKTDVVSLSIAPERIDDFKRRLGKPSREADLLEQVVKWYDNHDSPPTRKDLLTLNGVGKSTMNKLLDTNLISEEDNGSITLNFFYEDLDQTLFEMRPNSDVDLRVLRLLAREDTPVDRDWVEAQTGTTLPDLRRLEEIGLLQFGERRIWRDSLAGRDFVPMSAPRLTEGQRKVWHVVRAALDGDMNPLLASPVDGGGTRSQDRDAETHRRGERWHVPSELWAKLKPLAQEKRGNPTTAENRLWQFLKEKQRLGFKFRRQHAIDRFIVDFYSQAAALILEVDGEIHQYTQEEDQLRQTFLENLGFYVMRFTNEQVFTDIDSILSQIDEYLNHLLKSQSISTQNQAPSPSTGRAGVGSNTSSERRGLTTNTGVGSNTSSERRGLTTNTGVGSNTSSERRGLTSNTGVGSIFLLHGVTGSGKTEIYLRAIEHVLAQGKQAVFLVPEIALTAQTVRRVMARFPGKVAVLGEDNTNENTAPHTGHIALNHSKLNAGERYDTWYRARQGEVQIVVGPRSALFTPLPDIGLIILDEEHDSSYKQSADMQSPYYHTRDVAEYMAKQWDCMVILGSATPDIGTYTRAQRGEIGYLHLPDRIMGHKIRIQEQSARAGLSTQYTVDNAAASDAMTMPLPPVEVVDMREELKDGNTDMFSRALHSALSEVLARGEQALLYLNRRGAATYVFCRDCGYVAQCPNCDTPLTHHSYAAQLQCHHCGHHEPIPTICPSCQSERIKYFGAGTQQVEAVLNQHFPQVKALRWDADSASRKGAHDTILQRFINRDADVLIGTQMVAKGLDLPLVTLVGVVSADPGLALPDFRAGERIFQLLTQVAGRAGRGLLGGKVILQTYQPTHYAVAAAAQHDYEGFYTQEITNRHDLGYPPFRRLVRVLCRDEKEIRAENMAREAAILLQNRLHILGMTGTSVIGPAPCFFSRLNNQYRWQVLLRGPNPVRAFEDMTIPPHWHVDVDPMDVL